MELRTQVLLSIVAYSFCSGSLVLINKLTLHFMNYPSLVSTAQFAFTVAFIYAAKHWRDLPVDELEMKYIKPYLYYIAAFALGIYCNMKSLVQSNVETVIVFRALSPCLVSVLDALFLGREWPSTRSWFAVIGIALGAYGYALHDQQFIEQGPAAYFWPVLYLVVISFEMAYGKKLIASVDLKTRSGPVLYTNLLGILPMLGFAILAGEPSRLMGPSTGESSFSAAGALLLLLGCFVGTAIGYAAWWCRGQISATSFTLVGVLNKVMTVTVNALIWDQHANMSGIACLIVSLIFGTLYQQAPLRSSKNFDDDSIGKDDDVTCSTDRDHSSVGMEMESESDEDTDEEERKMLRSA